MTRSISKTQDIELIPLKQFRAGVARILSNTKKDSDKQLAKFQTSNAKKRAAKKRR
jgi:hypothetical protein